MPGFTLPDTDGNIVRLKAFKQRRPMLIALLHSATCPDCRAWLSGLVAARDELVYRDVQPAIIVPDDLAALRALRTELDPPGVLLSDPQRATLARYLRIEDETARRPVLLVAVGRYSECLDTWVADEPSRWPPLSEPVTTFAFAEQEDCSCGLPIWQDA